MKKVFIPTYDHQVGRMFKENKFNIVTGVEEADLICFTGGADVSPALYAHKKHVTTHDDIERDEYEVEIFNMAKALGLPMVGICRGGQFLNVMNGGTMFQDVTNHVKRHDAIIDGERLRVSSTHHQMMNPGKDGKVIGYAVGTAASRTYYDQRKEGFQTVGPLPGVLDVEVVVYGSHICFQPHPEFGMYDHSFLPLVRKFFNLIEKYCIKDEIPD